MKKLITLVAAMIGFGAFAVEPVITGTGFETAAYTAGSALAVSNDDAGVDYALEGYKGLVWEASKDLGEDAMVKAYDQDSGSYTPSATYLTRHDAIGNNYLGLDIGDARLDRYIVNGGKTSDQPKDPEAQEISATGFYIDTLVKFTAAEEPSWSAMQDTDKLSITYIEHDADAAVEDLGYTNFVIRAGYITQLAAGVCTITPTNYYMSVPANFDKSAWHRLTVRAIKDVGYAPAPVAFVVYVDEEMLQYSSSTKISTDNVTFGPMGTRFYSDTVHALLPSLINDVVTGKNISKIGFSGTGSIDNIAFVQNVIPEFVNEPTPVTLTWGEGFASITITPAGNDPITVDKLADGEFEFELPVGVNSFTVAATYEKGYEALPWMMNEVEIEGATFANVTPGSVCTLNAMKPVFNVIIGNIEQKFESLEDALAAIPAGDEGGTLKLMADYTGCVEVGDEKLIILDLAGNTITPGDPDTAAIMNSGAYLIITNSTPEAGVVLGSVGDNYAMLLCDDSTTEVYGGKFAGEILLDGDKNLDDVLTVFGGIFYDAVATGAEDFYLALAASLDPSVEGKVVGPDADGYFTVGVAPEVKPFQVIIADVATGYDTFELALAAANEAEAAKIVLGEDVPTAGKLKITGNVTIDLAGKTIAQDQTVEHTSGVLIVSHGGTLTIDDSSEPSAGKIDGGMAAYAAVAMTGKGDTADAKTATLVVKAGTLQGRHYGIVGNGSKGRGNTSVTIDGGVVKGLVENNCAGIYNPQGNSTVVINGGVVEGAVGIYAKAGTITVNGGEVKAVGAFVETPTFNGSGFEPCGDAIVLDSAAGYAGNVSLTLGDDATLTSANGFAVREAVTKGANTTLAIADNGATLTAPKGGLAVSDEFAEKLASGGATITGYTIAIDGVCGNDTLLAAIGKVADGGTITLLADVPNATGISIDSKKTFTVDFNGFTYTVNKPGAGSAGTSTQAFQLLKGQTITFKNGTINAAADNLVLAVAPAKNIKRFFQSYANLTLENMTLDGTNLYLNPTDNAVCEFANGTVALTGSTSIDAPANCIAVSVDNWKGKYPDGVDVTINTTGTIDGVKVWTEGTGAATPAELTLTAGTITSLEVAGEGTDFAVTKTGATVTAPEGYEWDETTGELKKVEEPTGLTLMIAGQPYNAETNPYVIRDAADFAILQADVALGASSVYGSATIVLTNDVDMTAAGAWTGIGQRNSQNPTSAFKGVFDGQGHKVTNLTIAGAKFVGLFNTVFNGTIKNLTVGLVGIVDGGLDDEFGGAVIGTVLSSPTAYSVIENVTAEGGFTGATYTSAGIAARSLSSETGTDAIRNQFINCTNNANIATSKNKVGGIIGIAQNTAPVLVGCVNNGTITREGEGTGGAVAGIVGYIGTAACDFTFSDCVNNGELVAVANNKVGAFVGELAQGTVKGLGGNVMDDELQPIGDGKVVTGFIYAIVADDKATFVADNALAAGKTYTLLANAAPVIELAENETISFVAGDFTLTADGIVAAEGCTVGDPVVDAGVTTFTAVKLPLFPRPGTEVIIAEQDGSAEHPWVIADEDDLLALAQAVAEADGFEDDCFVQKADITLTQAFPGIGECYKWSEHQGDWGSMKAFKGVYDGGEFAINDLMLDSSVACGSKKGRYMGLFNSVHGGKVMNLTVEFVQAPEVSGQDRSISVVGNLLSDDNGQAMVSNVTTVADAEIAVSHNSAGIVILARKCGTADAPELIDCVNNVSINNSDDTVAGVLCNPAGAGPIKLTGCVNNGKITVVTAGGRMGGIVANNQVTGDGTELILKDCVNAGALVTPDNYTTGGAFVGQDADPANSRVILESGNKMIASQIPFGAPNGKQKGFTYAIVDNAEPAMATFFADNALAADNTYTLYANAAPAITLAADESIIFDKNGFTLTATGIVPGEGAELEAPVEAGTRVTYSAKAASTAPEFDGGTVIMVAEEGGTITNGNSTMTITLETGWTVAKNVDGIWELKNGDTVFGKFPAYYDAVVSEAGVVSIALNAKALCEMDLGTEAEPEDPLTVTENSVSLAVKNIQDNLYYGLATKASLDAKDWTAPAEYILGSELKKQPVLEATKVDDAAAGFYVISVTDVPAK